jgi:hypothetical protein
MSTGILQSQLLNALDGNSEMLVIPGNSNRGKTKLTDDMVVFTTQFTSSPITTTATADEIANVSSNFHPTLRLIMKP